MKKAIVILMLLTISLCSAFAVSQIRTSFVPYSWQRFDSSEVDDKTFNADYGWGMKVAYLYSLYNGITFGGEIGSFHYMLPNITGSESDYEVGSCGVCPATVKFGYFTPLHKEKAIRYFVYGEAGVRLLQAADEASANPFFGVEVGFSFSLPKNFHVGLAVEPLLSFSKKEINDTRYTDFYVHANLVLGYEF